VSERQLIVARDGAVLRVTINRPERRNALRMALLDEIGAAFASHAADPAIRFAVLTGAGDRCFAAGGDLQELSAIRSVEDTLAMSRRGRRALQHVREFPVPVICALNGHALGGGAELALACDLRVATPEAEIGFLQATLNVTTAWGGGIDLAATIGDRPALELLASGRRVRATEAIGLGLISRVASDRQSLAASVNELTAEFSDRPRAVLEGIKAVACGTRRERHAQLREIEEQHFVMTWTHENHWRAVEASGRGA
jgi:enoyl-CoA hydratase/carnithine racemase